MIELLYSDKRSNYAFFFENHLIHFFFKRVYIAGMGNIFLPAFLWLQHKQTLGLNCKKIKWFLQVFFCCNTLLVRWLKKKRVLFLTLRYIRQSLCRPFSIILFLLSAVWLWCPSAAETRCWKNTVITERYSLIRRLPKIVCYCVAPKVTESFWRATRNLRKPRLLFFCADRLFW